MQKYWLFLKYLLCHKWFVFLECWQMGVPWRGMTHDVSKFWPEEFISYANYYYENHICSPPADDPIDCHSSRYLLTWLKHHKRNRHHWQWWILYGDDNQPTALPMDDKYIKEMVADWRGAGRAQGQSDTMTWYQRNKNKMILHASTRQKVEQLLQMDVNARQLSSPPEIIVSQNLQWEVPL